MTHGVCLFSLQVCATKSWHDVSFRQLTLMLCSMSDSVNMTYVRHHFLCHIVCGVVEYGSFCLFYCVFLTSILARIISSFVSNCVETAFILTRVCCLSGAAQGTAYGGHRKSLWYWDARICIIVASGMAILPW